MATFREYGKALENFDINEVYDGDNLSYRFAEWVRNEVLGLIENEFSYLALGLDSDKKELSKVRSEKIAEVYKLIEAFHPNLNPDEQGFIAIWPDKKARGQGRKGRVYLRYGRAIRKMFPVLTDKELEVIVDKAREKFSEKTYKLHSGQERADFRHAYATEHDVYENPSCNYTRKHLSTSCMRYSFDRLKCHPTEAYASGDFTIFWAERSGKIAGRCVVMTADNDWHAGPIYGVSEKAMNEIWAKINNDCPGQVYDSEAACWEGAKMLNIEHGKNSVIAPYLDVTPRHISKHSDEFLVIDECGEYDASNYQGVLSALVCCQCEENICDGDHMYHEDDLYCETCYHDTYSNCERCGNIEVHEDFAPVYVALYGNTSHPYEENWCYYCRDCHAVETVNGETWCDRSVLVTYNGNYIPERDLDEGYFYSEWDGQIYECDLMVEVNGETVSRIELENQPLPYKQNDNGTYVLVEENNAETETNMESEANA